MGAGEGGVDAGNGAAGALDGVRFLRGMVDHKYSINWLSANYIGIPCDPMMPPMTGMEPHARFSQRRSMTSTLARGSSARAPSSKSTSITRTREPEGIRASSKLTKLTK